MIYRIQGDKTVSWPCTWERLERKCFYCGICSSQGVTHRKMGKTSIFLSAQHCLGMDRKRDGSVLGEDAPGIFLDICAGMRGNPKRGEEFGVVTLPPKSICSPKSELSPFSARMEAMEGGLKSGPWKIQRN